MGSLTPSTITTTTTTSSSTTTTRKTTTPPFHLLEITIISAQDLAPVSKSMRTYAMVWVQPEQRKLTTRVDDRGGHANPTWNDKFVFRIDDDFLNSESTSAVMVEIYTASWFRDNLVGNVKVLINNLIPPFPRPHNHFTTRFVALQVRRASGSPQGILNMGVSLLDDTYWHSSMPIYKQLTASESGFDSGSETHLPTHNNKVVLHNHDDQVNAKIQLWRSQSHKSDHLNIHDDYDFYPTKCNGAGGSILNNDSELCSDVGPSASIVAAAIAKKGLYPTTAEQRGTEEEERGSSILEDLTVEEATAKGYRSSRAVADLGKSEHSRRHSDAGLFSCFAYGFEFTIVCGTKNEGRNKNGNSAGIDKPVIKRSPSHHQNLSF